MKFDFAVEMDSANFFFFLMIFEEVFVSVVGNLQESAAVVGGAFEDGKAATFADDNEALDAAENGVVVSATKLARRLLNTFLSVVVCSYCQCNRHIVYNYLPLILESENFSNIFVELILN